MLGVCVDRYTTEDWDLGCMINSRNYAHTSNHELWGKSIGAETMWINPIAKTTKLNMALVRQAHFSIHTCPPAVQGAMLLYACLTGALAACPRAEKVPDGQPLEPAALVHTVHRDMGPPAAGVRPLHKEVPP